MAGEIPTAVLQGPQTGIVVAGDHNVGQLLARLALAETREAAAREAEAAAREAAAVAERRAAAAEAREAAARAEAAAARAEATPTPPLPDAIADGRAAGP